MPPRVPLPLPLPQVDNLRAFLQRHGLGAFESAMVDYGVEHVEGEHGTPSESQPTVTGIHSYESRRTPPPGESSRNIHIVHAYTGMHAHSPPPSQTVACVQ